VPRPRRGARSLLDHRHANRPLVELRRAFPHPEAPINAPAGLAGAGNHAGASPSASRSRSVDGIDDDFIRGIGETLKEGKSALFCSFGKSSRKRYMKRFRFTAAG